ncbi:MAG: hypothetical protein HOM68_07130 [Gemmatimonadetes bacterium]|jgi:hypothetical protein|nr:hypothetical protein [Gemmatimonadota bacterium]MBT4608627.1 hypothetical protein [Gemmatimonadota bacterium]MBT5056295.1 hypothetical protein [Gemmatimonadota bacterium]MBT5144794.1 hypothetical protein [Gemmatimonadota bacterium]MBT5587271.1 hypothetical protein [Gemmatimonadota bacterium]
MQKTTDSVFGFLAGKPVIWVVAALWAVTNALMTPLLFKLRALSGTMIPDVTPLHDAAFLTTVFAAYGPEGMEMYRQVALLDWFYPAGYALFWGALIFILFRSSRIRNLAWLPVLAAACDYAENHYLDLSASNITNIDPAAASTSGTIVLLKMLCIASSVGLIIYGLIRWNAARKAG